VKQLGYFETRQDKLYFIPKHRTWTDKATGIIVVIFILLLCMVSPLVGLFLAGIYYLSPHFGARKE